MPENVINVQFSQPRLSDAQWIGQLVPQALEQGRYTLATELIRLAGRAAAHDRARAEAAALVPVEHHQAQTQLFGTVPTQNAPLVNTEGPGYGSRAPQDCCAITMINAATAADTEPQWVPGQRCNQPLGWSDGGTSNRKGWYHLDRALDENHDPIPGQG